jgi:hypothetical protein
VEKSPSMVDRACLKSAVLNSTSMTINKASAFTPHNCQSYSPIDDHNRKKNSLSRWSEWNLSNIARPRINRPSLSKRN